MPSHKLTIYQLDVDISLKWFKSQILILFLKYLSKKND